VPLSEGKKERIKRVGKRTRGIFGCFVRFVGGVQEVRGSVEMER